MASRRPSTEWQESPVEHRWIIIHTVAFLSDTLKQLTRYDVYKSDCFYYVLELWDDKACKIYKMLEKHSFILRPIYELSNCMVYYNITNPLPAIGGLYSMTEINPNPTYPKLKYTRGFVGVRVTNVSHCKRIIEILDRNELDLQYVIQDYAPEWSK